MRPSRLVLAALIAGVCQPVSLAAGQTPISTTDAWTPPRTPWGDPDLQGVWKNATLTPLERPAHLAEKESFSEEELIEATRRELQRIDGDQRAGQSSEERQPDTPDGRSDVGRAYNEFWRERGVLLKRTSLIVDPSDGKLPPLTPEAKHRVAARAAAARGRGPADSWEDRNLAERCIHWNAGPPMMPTTYNGNAQVLQTPQHVVVLNEMIHDVRVIPLDGRPHGTLRQLLGDSRGRWEGETLVVETVNFTDKTRFRGSTIALRVIERFTRVSPDVLNYEFTVEDPKTWTRPWTARIPLPRTDDRLYEYACHEGNSGLIGILRGARAEEKAAQEGGTTGRR